MGNIDSVAYSYDQNLMASSTTIDSTSTAHQDQQPSSSSESNTQREQSNERTLELNNMALNEANDRFSINLTGNLLGLPESLIASIKTLQCENNALKMKQAVNNGEDKLLDLYEVLLGKFEKLCEEKDKRLVEKDEQLAHKSRMIELLQTDNAEKNEQLRLKSRESKSIQAKLSENEEKLAENASLIQRLHAECGEKNIQLAENAITINDLQVETSNKDAQLVENTDLINQLKEDYAKKDAQMKATLDRLKDLGKTMHNTSDLFVGLFDCGSKCFDQNEYAEALVYFDNAIVLEKMTHKRSSELATLFSWKAACYCHLKQYQQAIEAANVALQHNSSICKTALYNRAAAYFELKQYANACQDLEKALKLNPNDEYARELLVNIQDGINASSSV